MPKMIEPRLLTRRGNVRSGLPDSARRTPLDRRIDLAAVFRVLLVEIHRALEHGFGSQGREAHGEPSALQLPDPGHRALARP
jgi:hypothetical protein